MPCGWFQEVTLKINIFRGHLTKFFFGIVVPGGFVYAYGRCRYLEAKPEKGDVWERKFPTFSPRRAWIVMSG